MSDDYDVGYGKPPRHTQFKPGKSGNPKGRPKGTKNLANDLAEELEEKITVTEGGVPLEVTKQRAMLKALLAKAMKGDPRAANVLMSLKLGLEQLESGQREDKPLDPEDQAILDAYADQLQNTNGGTSDE